MQTSLERVRVHPTAIVDPGARLEHDVDIGPYAIVEAGASIGARTRIRAHAFVAGCCEIGSDCEIDVAAVVGGRAQIRGSTGPGGGVRIGPGCVIREHATIHRAGEPGRWTTLGSGVYVMAAAHVGHDCDIDDDATIVSGARLAGFVTVQRRAFISGNVVVHQFDRIGELSMTGGGAVISKDVPPFMLAADRSIVYGVNVVGLRRAGIPPARRGVVREAHRLIYRSGLNVSRAMTRVEALDDTPEIRSLVTFVAASRRGICAGPRAFTQENGRMGERKG